MIVYQTKVLFTSVTHPSHGPSYSKVPTDAQLRENTVRAACVLGCKHCADSRYKWVTTGLGRTADSKRNSIGIRSDPPTPVLFLPRYMPLT